MKDKEPLSFRLEPELHQRLEECAKRTRIKKYQLAILALEAAVEAIEKNGYRLVVPIEFQVSQVPAPLPPGEAKFPPHRSGDVAFAEETDLAKPPPTGSSSTPLGKYPTAKLKYAQGKIRQPKKPDEPPHQK